MSPPLTGYMLSSLGRFTTRYLLVTIIFICLIISSFLDFCAIDIYYTNDTLIQMFVNCLPGILIFAVFISPPLLSLFLMRRPSFWRVLLHVASVFYILWIVIAFFSASPLNLSWTNVIPIFLLVYSGAALIAGLPEAVAAGEWAILVYYTALVFWFSVMVVMVVLFVVALFY